jgi:hypothetical protein
MRASRDEAEEKFLQIEDDLRKERQKGKSDVMKNDLNAQVAKATSAIEALKLRHGAEVAALQQELDKAHERMRRMAEDNTLSKLQEKVD